MHIAYIIPGSGGSFYCENCLRDLSLVQEIKKMGHTVTIIPLYLPFYINPLMNIPDDIKKNGTPVFYGAVNLYLKHFYPVYKKIPAWIKKILDSTFFLKQSAKQSGSTNSINLNDLTISMLKGEDGNQIDELMNMIEWLEPNIKPDIIHISTALLSGMANELKKIFNVPIVCFFQDEDSWIDVMDDRSKIQAWKIIEDKSKNIDKFLFPSWYYQNFISNKINLPDNKKTVIYNGLDLSLYESGTNEDNDSMVIGYLSRMSEQNGLGFLIDAFIDLKKSRKFLDMELHLCGGFTGDDRKFIKAVNMKLKKNNLLGKVKYSKKIDFISRKKFLKEIDALTVPGCGHAFGLYQVESFASGKPVIQPDCGVFNEIIEKTGAGLIYKHNDINSYKEKIISFFNSKNEKDRLRINATNAAKNFFDIKNISKEMISLYFELIEKYRS